MSFLNPHLSSSKKLAYSLHSFPDINNPSLQLSQIQNPLRLSNRLGKVQILLSYLFLQPILPQKTFQIYKIKQGCRRYLKSLEPLLEVSLSEVRDMVQTLMNLESLTIPANRRILEELLQVSGGNEPGTSRSFFWHHHLAQRDKLGYQRHHSSPNNLVSYSIVSSILPFTPFIVPEKLYVNVSLRVSFIT
jgi:hypothetical protein